MTSSGRILVVDDDPNLIELIRMRLESANHEVITALTEEEAVKTAKEQVFDLSIVDLKLADRDGISLMEELHQINPDIPVIILTAHGSIESAVEAMKRGAYNYLTKPFDPREMLLQIERALQNRRLTSEIKRLKGLLEEKYGLANVVAKSEKMQRILDVVSRIAKTDSTVYIHGESGTGKELIAKAIHLASDRKDKSFVAINCAALPENLLESELFGHEKGAFTGAIRSTKGLFTQAHEGTIFLDEIGDMPLALGPLGSSPGCFRSPDRSGAALWRRRNNCNWSQLFEYGCRHPFRGIPGLSTTNARDTASFEAKSGRRRRGWVCGSQCFSFGHGH